MTKVLKPVSKKIKDPSEDVTKTLMVTSEEINKTLENLQANF